MKPLDWERVRELRLSALEDAPDAFSNTLAHEQSFDESTWRARLSEATTFLATLDGQDVGMMTVSVQPDARTGLAMGVWVSPNARGQRIGAQLFEFLFNWARAQDLERITLDVGNTNTSAQTLYKNLGFLPTGRTGSLPVPRTHVLEHELERWL